MKDLGIVASFKVFPRMDKPLYLTVQVFKTRRLMHGYCRRYCTHYMGAKTTAVCHSFKRLEIRPGKRDRVHPEIGSMHFYLNRVDPSIVVHECSHAAIFWVRRVERKEIIKIGDESDNGYATGVEESICLATGDLFYQINKEFWKRGIWK